MQQLTGLRFKRLLLTGAAAGKSFGTVAAGAFHNLALASTGELYAWGDGSQGQMGNGSTAS